MCRPELCTWVCCLHCLECVCVCARTSPRRPVCRAYHCLWLATSRVYVRVHVPCPWCVACCCVPVCLFLCVHHRPPGCACLSALSPVSLCAVLWVCTYVQAELRDDSSPLLVCAACRPSVLSPESVHACVGALFLCVIVDCRCALAQTLCMGLQLALCGVCVQCVCLAPETGGAQWFRVF